MRRKAMRARLTAAILVLALAGCSVERLPVTERPAASPSGSAAAPPSTVAPSESPDPALWTPPPAAESPGEPPADLPLTVTVERDGVRLTLQLERNPMPSGEWTRAQATVTNVGSDDLVWFHDGCADPVSIWGELVGQHWRPGFAQFAGKVREFQQRAVEEAAFDGAIRVRFLEEDEIGEGIHGCADIGLADVVPQGDKLTAERIWDGQAFGRLIPPPGGPVTLTATFAYYWRGNPADVTGIDGMSTLELQLPTWIQPPTRQFIHPAEAIDVALLDRRLQAVIATRDLWNANEDLLRFDLDRGIWEVGLLDHHEDGRGTLHAVEIEGQTGTRIRWVERRWDFQVDGFP